MGESMKKILLSLLLFLQIFLFSDEIVSVRVSEYPPFYFKNKDVWRGLSTEMISELLKEAGFQSSFVNLPWKRGLMDVKHGKLDVLCNVTITDDRKDYMYFIGPQMTETMVLYSAKQNYIRIEKLDDIKKLPGKIGIQLGTYYGDNFHQKYLADKDFRDKFIICPNGFIMLKMFNNYRIIGFINEKYDLNQYTKFEERFNKHSVDSYIISKEDVYFGFSKKTFSKEDIVVLNNAYRNLQESNIFNKIIAVYLTTD